MNNLFAMGRSKYQVSAGVSAGVGPAVTAFRLGLALLDLAGLRPDTTSAVPSGGVLVSTWEIRQRRHAEDDPLASLIIGSNINC